MLANVESSTPEELKAVLSGLSVEELQKVKKALSSRTSDKKIVIRYWPFLGRASPFFRMCAEAGVEFEHESDPEKMQCALFGAKTTNLAPPMVVDGDVIVSQAPAVAKYLGEKLGLTAGIKNPSVALQYTMDISDLHEAMRGAFNGGIVKKDLFECPKFMAERFTAICSALERAIQGPFFFGEKFSWVDFALAGYWDMIECKWLEPLREKTGDVLASFPKIKAIIAAIRALPSAAKITVPKLGADLTPELVATYPKEELPKVEVSSDPPTTAKTMTIMYWPFLARASPLFRMCAEAGVEFEHVSDPEKMQCALFGAKTSNLAPPMVVDGDVIVSQAPAAAMYLGEKFGFTAGIKVPEIALQYVSDVGDLHEAMRGAFNPCIEKGDLSEAPKFMSERFNAIVGAIERSIQGPFYFGEKFTWVDFSLAGYWDMIEFKWLEPLKEKTGDVLADCPKIKAIVAAIRALPSTEKLSGIPKLGADLQPELVATWPEVK